ncbi:hypothetical protein B296_00055436 [Ensete ventricosum]|uniref:Uncharacterized protein n=1 Tax=Ensete ventricosum TaxID=4639 RepID=A0A426X217_ENSVE|nr:hypothetical protein B296_00055436 [Ensete ventricosum]
MGEQVCTLQDSCRRPLQQDRKRQMVLELPEGRESCNGWFLKKTTTMSIAQVVFCKTLVDGVVGVEVEDAVAGSGTKKTTARATGSAAVSAEGSPEV